MNPKTPFELERDAAADAYRERPNAMSRPRLLALARKMEALESALAVAREALERYKFISAEPPGAVTHFSAAAEALAALDKIMGEK